MAALIAAGIISPGRGGGPAAAKAESDPIAAYLKPVMEGMGVRHRPEVSVGTVVRQTLRTAVDSGGYGAGGYWRSTLGGGGDRGGVGGGRTKPTSAVDGPVLSLLGNTTRSHSYLAGISADLGAALSRRYSGYLTRDVSAGLAPEGEDCAEALEGLLDLADVYLPPSGSGLVAGSDDEYHDGDLD